VENDGVMIDGVMVNGVLRNHCFSAQAKAFSGQLELPLRRKIEPQAFVELLPKGGYESSQGGEFRVDSAISYSSATTQVGGNLEVKKGRGWNTLATATIEGLNIMEVVTCDRIVAQINTEHPREGYIPEVNFLGTRFENLRIAGHKVELDLDLGIFGERPKDDQPYTRDEKFKEQIAKYKARLEPHLNPLAALVERYNRVPADVDTTAPSQEAAKGPAAETADCSLVTKAEGGYPGHTYGHVIHVPNFGVIYLATLRLEHSDPHPVTNVPRKTAIHLNMVQTRMGSNSTGGTDAGQGVVQGTTHP
jgi:hypothetical protein